MKLLIMDIPVRKSLFWDINIDRMDEQKNRRLIIERVFCLGNMEELKFIYRFYGINIIRKEVIKAGNLDSKTLNFASEILDIPVNEFRCYKRRQSVKSYYFQARSTLKGSIEGIQLDLITHNYPLVSSPLSLEGIRMVSPEDIAAMKVNAIAGDGTRSKDFIDVYFLLKDYSFKQIIEFFSVKYNSRNNAHTVKSMTWFDDVDKADWPVMVREPDLTFARIRSEIVRHRDIYLAGEGLIRGS